MIFLKQLFFFITTTCLISCNSDRNEVLEANMLIEEDNIAYCDSIRVIEDEFEKSDGNSNRRINSIVPILVKQSNLEASCSKGTVGYLYFMESDSVFYSDINRWKNYFHCE